MIVLQLCEAGSRVEAIIGEGEKGLVEGLGKRDKTEE